MSDRSPIHRFLNELRRRHVPETAAIYMVAAWAAIQFADVIVPNLGWSEGIVTAVIVAAAVGLPVALILAWVFEWGPEGLHRTPEEEPDPRIGRTGSPTRATSGPWVTAVAVLVVGITSALAVAVVLDRADGDDGGSGPGAGAEAARPGLEGRGTGGPGGPGGDVPRPQAPPIPELPPGIFSEAFTDSMEAMVESLTALERLDSLEVLREAGERFGRERSLLIGTPTSWSFGSGVQPLAEGATLRVQGVARDSGGVVEVRVDGAVVAEGDSPPARILPFATTITGTGSEGVRVVPITFRTGDGREVVREYQIQQLPGG